VILDIMMMTEREIVEEVTACSKVDKESDEEEEEEEPPICKSRLSELRYHLGDHLYRLII
jgi:hypothetical protein